MMQKQDPNDPEFDPLSTGIVSEEAGPFTTPQPGTSPAIMQPMSSPMERG